VKRVNPAVNRVLDFNGGLRGDGKSWKVEAGTVIILEERRV
jgi:hypothetical protein